MISSLLLVRHGQSTWNAERRWQGQADPPLSEFGRDQARRAAQTLHSVAESIDVVVSSPQLRAAETADILLAHTPSLFGVESVERDRDLRERSVGPWSGLTKLDIEEQYPGYLASDQRPAGFELDDSLFERVSRSLRRIGTNYSDRTVLVVCHGGVINTLVSRLGVVDGRTPNLSGYRLFAESGVITVQGRFDLLEESDRTGGDANRV
ncbi:MAG: histidine phosphatase family protein [Acidimicrobiales bacterium]